MKIRISVLALSTIVAAAATSLAPAAAQAQSNRGQLVQAIVKLNNAQLAFAKKLADDQQFAAEFDKATSSGNNDAAAQLAASVTGLSKSSIYVNRGVPGGDDDHETASARSTTSVYQLASFSPAKTRRLSGKICFDVFVAHGCIAF
jgi:hypothetical protein